jgi:FkbM family methyltransferase
MQKLKKRFRRFWSDVHAVTRTHGYRIGIVYSFAKTMLLVPILSSFFRKVCRQKILMRTRVLGSWMYVNLLDPGISHQLLVHGMREQGHVEQVRGAVTAGMKGLEIGANIGYYALLEGHLVGPSGHIYCIEPAPANFQLLQKNIAANHFEDRTSCFQYLVGEKSGKGKLFLSVAANSHSVSAVSDQFVELPMVTIDDFLATKGINSAEIDFLRMDIEGYEVMVFQHMRTLLINRKKPLKLFIELHPFEYGEWGWTIERFINYLVDLGFIPKSVTHVEIGGQGLVTERAVNLENGLGVAEVLRRASGKENKSGFLDNWFFEFTP